MSQISKWNLVDVFTVNQAAALWCGVDPAIMRKFDFGTPSEVLAVKQMLVAAIKTDQLQADHSENTLKAIGDYSDSSVIRDDLIQLAKAKSETPTFLFDTFAPFQPRSPSSHGRQTTATVKSKPKGAGGRPAEYDWDSFAFEIIHRANSIDGLPDTQAELIRDMLAWFRETYDAEPAESSVKSRVSKIYRYLEEARNQER